MKTRVILAGALALGLVTTPMVIGRFGGAAGELPGLDVLLGYGVVATLVAFITMEYRVRARRVLATRRTQARLLANANSQEAKVVVLPVHDDRAAA